MLLVSDKPLYQPGQLMHLRALALRSFDLKPAAGADLTFEVEDGKGNKVFKQALKTSDFGVASADFQLADEVNAGDYHIRAILGDHTADKTVTVKPYVLPKFKADVTADKKFYLPKETIKADLQSDYFFGKPVAGAKVKVTASTFDVAFKDFQTVDLKTDAKGHAKFEIQLPDYFVGQPLQKGDALVKIEAKVTDSADHTETITRTYPVSDQAGARQPAAGGRSHHARPGEPRLRRGDLPRRQPGPVRRASCGSAMRRKASRSPRSRPTRRAWPSSRSRPSRSSSTPARRASTTSRCWAASRSRCGAGRTSST